MLIMDDFVFRQLASSEMDIKYKKMIAELIYETDPYIYPAMFGDKKNALNIIPELLDSGDEMFKYENLFVAEKETDLCGIILWYKGSLKWNEDVFRSTCKKLNARISKYFDKVKKEYISHYEKVDENVISIINVSVLKEKQNQGIGTELLESFIKEHVNEKMELCVLDDNDIAKRVYEKMGFKYIEKYNGFFVKQTTIICERMRR